MLREPQPRIQQLQIHQQMMQNQLRNREIPQLKQ